MVPVRRQVHLRRERRRPPLRVVRGEYATAVNLYNASAADVALRKHLALTYPPARQASGEVSNQIEDVVAPGPRSRSTARRSATSSSSRTRRRHGSRAGLPRDREQQFRCTSKPSTPPRARTGDVSIDVERIAERKVIPRPFVAPDERGDLPLSRPAIPTTSTRSWSTRPRVPAHQAHGDTLGELPDDD